MARREFVAPPIRSSSCPGARHTRAVGMRHDKHIAERGRQRAARCQPAGHQCRAVGIECRLGWHVHRRMGRPVLQRRRLDHPDGPGRRRPWFEKIYGRLTTFEVLDPVKQAADFDANSGVYGELTGDLAESWEVSTTS